MKKIILAGIMVLALTMIAFAQSYTVQEVTGRVEQELGSDTWEAVKAGDVLKEDAMIRTLVGASLTVKAGEEVLRVGSMKTGKLSDIAGNEGVIQIKGKISTTDTAAVNRDTGRVSTASARANTGITPAEVVEEE